MALTEGDKAICAQLAEKIIKEVMLEHVNTCPHGITLLHNKKMLIATVAGVILGTGIVNGGIILAAIKLMLN